MTERILLPRFLRSQSHADQFGQGRQPDRHQLLRQCDRAPQRHFGQHRHARRQHQQCERPDQHPGLERRHPRDGERDADDAEPAARGLGRDRQRRAAVHRDDDDEYGGNADRHVVQGRAPARRAASTSPSTRPRRSETSPPARPPRAIRTQMSPTISERCPTRRPMAARARPPMAT